MNSDSDLPPGDESIAAAEGELARLGVQVDAMQALLVRLLQDVIKAEAGIEEAQPGTLVEVNERLIMSALSSAAKAETAALALETAKQSVGLDALTGLPNRATFLDRFTQAITGSKRRGSRSAVLFLDLDNFKALNDAHGHPFGDKVLVLAAERMLEAVREVDTVSRHGGDEFLILLAELNLVDDARRVAEKLIESITRPAQIDGVEVRLTASVGMAIYPDDAEDVATLVAHADAAMYESKRSRVGLVLDADLATRSATATSARVHTDLAALQRRNEDLRDANEKLLLAALSAQELREAAELAHQRQHAVIAAVAEELSNPLAPIRIATAMLGRPVSDEPVLPRVQSILEEQIAQVSHLIDHLVDASEPAVGGLDPRRELVDLSEVIDAAVAGMRVMMDTRAQLFEIERPTGPLCVQGDAMMLGLVVSNLLHNASKHTYNGGRIVLSVAISDSSLTLTVSDNGIGISPAMLPYIYAPFVQDTQALGLNGIGTGIGLTVVRTLVEAHGGTLSAHSLGVRRGSSFVVTLPRILPMPIAVAANPIPMESRSGG